MPISEPAFETLDPRHSPGVNKYMRLGFMASHNGTNMRAIVAACRSGELAAEPALLISNNGDCGAIAWAEANGVPWRHISATSAGSPEAADAAMAAAFVAAETHLIVLAGYMRRLGPKLLAAFPSRILNVHPALLPKYGGAGMYGRFVHEAVLKAGDRESGVTIHVVDDEYDHGPVVAQARVPVAAGDTVESLTQRVQAEEGVLYIRTLQRIAAGQLNLGTHT